MGMYTSLRFKGYIKPEFREEFKGIALTGEWRKAKDSTLNSFSRVDRASFIPCGSLNCAPETWEIASPSDKYRENAKATDGFERTYNPETGCWAFQCSLKNYSDTISVFLKILPHFASSITHLEIIYEEWDWSKKYELIGNRIQMTNDHFIKYNDYD